MSLEGFPCAGYREEWSETAEYMLQNLLPGEIEAGTCQATGIWDGEELCGVSAWRLDPTTRVVESILLAVRYRRRHRGYGRQLKEHLIEQARSEGALSIVSTVHWDNLAMLRLNRTLGASIRRIPGDDEYARCVLPL